MSVLGLFAPQRPWLTCCHRCHTIPDKCTEDPADHHIEDTLMWSTDPEVNPPFHDFGNSRHSVCIPGLVQGSCLWTTAPVTSTLAPGGQTNILLFLESPREASADSGGFIFHGRHIVEVGEGV